LLQSISATGNRKLLQTYPAVDTRLDISTNNDLAGNQAAELSDATNKTYALASAIGAQGTPYTPPPPPSPLLEEWRPRHSKDFMGTWLNLVSSRYGTTAIKSKILFVRRGDQIITTPFLESMNLNMQCTIL
jgi:hypothetical protein